MAVPWFAAILSIFALWLFSCVHRFYTNYQNARRSGIPTVLCPVNPQNPLFMIVNAPLRPFLERVLPTAVFDRLKLSIYGWEFRDKHEFHDRIGPVFILVTYGVNELWCADPAMAQIILTRRKDFLQLPQGKMIMGLLGTNMLSSDGETWARQRRVVAPNLNERVSELVWKESMTQARQMADYMLSQPEGVTHQTVSALRAIAINVLGQVGYGQPKPFKPMELPRNPEAKMSYIDAISLVTELLAVAAFIPKAVLALPMMPLVLQTLGAAMRKLPSLTSDMLEQERQRAATSSHTRDNIMSMLVRFSDQAKLGKGEPAAVANGGAKGPADRSGSGLAAAAAAHTGQYLSEEEIAGNMFLVTGAGFDTTANTLSYAAVIMAAHPETQAWVQEELDRVFGPPGKGSLDGLDYATVYPKLIRCLALMFETLRLYPAVTHLSRSTAASQTITTGAKAYHLLGRYDVLINNACLHTTAASWGADADEFRPARWVAAAEGDTHEPSLVTPARGTFLPWSTGPRACPGQKMSQVEFVVVIATLFWRCSVRPVRRGGETKEQARQRLLDLMVDSQPRLTLQMNRPDDIELQWVKR